MTGGQPAADCPVATDPTVTRGPNLVVGGRTANNFLLTVATAASTRDNCGVLLA